MHCLLFSMIGFHCLIVSNNINITWSIIAYLTNRGITHCSLLWRIQMWANAGQCNSQVIHCLYASNPLVSLHYCSLGMQYLIPSILFTLVCCNFIRDIIFVIYILRDVLFSCVHTNCIKLFIYW